MSETSGSSSAPRAEVDALIAESERLADLLALKGKGLNRICPKCRGAKPTLTLGPRSYSCSQCGASGDEVELVCLVRDCEEDEAEDWLNENLPPILTGPVTLTPPADKAAPGRAAAVAGKPDLAPTKPGVPGKTGPVSSSPSKAAADDDDDAHTLRPLSSEDDDDDLSSLLRDPPAAASPAEAKSSAKPSDRKASGDSPASSTLRTLLADDDDDEEEAVIGGPDGDDALEIEEVVDGDGPAVAPLKAVSLSEQPVAKRRGIQAVLEAFMEQCRPLPDKVVSLLAQWGITPEAAQRFRLRYYPHNYKEIIDGLEEQFGTETMFEAGLLIDAGESGSATSVGGDSDGTAIADVGSITGSFSVYHDLKIPYFIMPYLERNEPVMLKARPLVDVAKRGKEIPRELATREDLPTLFNIDCLIDAQKVMVFRRELDAMAAFSCSRPAVAYVSSSRFKSDWVHLLADKKVALMVIDGEGDLPRVMKLMDLFAKEGMPAPFRVDVPPGQTLVQFLGGPKALPPPPTFAPRPAGAIAADAAAGRGAAKAKGAADAPEDEDGPDLNLLAAVSGGPRRMIAVQTGGKEAERFFRLLYWIRQRDGTDWYPETRLKFKFAIDGCEDVAAAMRGAVAGEPTTMMPDWLRRRSS